MALLERAARAGHVKAQNLAGLHYASGVRVPADYPKALSYLRPAAERGDKDAQNNLAHLLYFGLGMRQDLRGALAWAEKASAKGVGASDKLLVEIKGEMRDPSIPASSPESTKTMDAQRLDEVAADLRARRDAGKKYGLPFPEDRKPVLDAIAQLVKLGDNVRAAELIAMSREIVARAGIEEDKIYGDFKRSLARLEASANGGS